MVNKTALFYHLNLSHYSLTANLRKIYIDEGIMRLVNAIKVPTNFSLSAQDLESIYKEAKPTYKSLLNNKNIKFHVSTYSHFLPRDFPRDIDIQLDLGIKIFEELLPEEKIIRTGLFAEFDIPKNKVDFQTVSKYIDTLLINHTLVKHNGLDACPAVFKYKLNNNSILRLICVHKNTHYRNVYHKYLREMASSEDVIQSIHDDGNSKNPTICHIDFETPIINIVRIVKNGKERESPPRYDLFEKLHKKLLNSDLHFVYLDPSQYAYNVGIKEVSSFQDLSLGVSRNDYYYESVNKLRDNRDILLKRDPKAYMEAINSDNFVSNQKDIDLNGYYKGTSGTIRIKKSGNREAVMDSLLKKLEIFE